MADAENGPQRKGLKLAIAIAILLAGGALLAFGLTERSTAQQAQAPRAAAAVPVSVANAERQDVPVWLRGIGTVQALNTVTVRARVDGTLMQVPVAEGQVVKQGTLLAVIDPRPYQASLDQANAKKAQDEVMLANAKLDLQRYSSLASQSFASRQQVDTQQMQVDQLTAATEGRRGDDRGGAAQSQLLLHHCAVRWAARTAPGRCRQPRACIRQRRDHDDHSGASDRGGVHAAAAQTCRRSSRRCRKGR